MPIYLLLVSIIIFACVILNKISSKLGIPMLLAFILLGMFFGSDGFVKIPFENYRFAEQICSVALIFIMFYGGFGTNWNEAKPVAKKAIMLSTAGVIMTAGLTGLFCHFVLKIDILESLLIGSVISSTDAASVFSILRSKNLGLRDNTASMLEIESGSNDPCSYMLTAIFIAAIKGANTAGSMAYMIFAQIAYGLVCGVLIAALGVIFMRKYRFTTEGFSEIFAVGVAVISYALPTALGGNGYLSAYIVGIILGNTHIKNKKKLVIFFDGITALMQMAIFFLLGLLSFPSLLPGVAFEAMLIALFITFVARPATIFALLGKKSSTNQKLLVSWSGLRGAASIVFAIMAKMAITTTLDIFHVVFFIVLFSILIQGSLIPFMSRKLNMIDDEADVMKTFNDYVSKPIGFVRFTIPEGHKWCGKELKELWIPPDMLFVLIKRKGENIIPDGDTVLMAGDNVIACAAQFEDRDGITLTETEVTKDSHYNGKTIAQLPGDNGGLIIMIQRKDEIIIPNGDVRLQKGDILVTNQGL
ncbi:MAG: potassium/proton antiporter [Clostridia bacterium]|nr:potassium/proton antiporter [Clostridia bacterium]